MATLNRFQALMVTAIAIPWANSLSVKTVAAALLEDDYDGEFRYDRRPFDVGIGGPAPTTPSPRPSTRVRPGLARFTRCPRSG